MESSARHASRSRGLRGPRRPIGAMLHWTILLKALIPASSSAGMQSCDAFLDHLRGGAEHLQDARHHRGGGQAKRIRTDLPAVKLSALMLLTNPPLADNHKSFILGQAGTAMPKSVGLRRDRRRASLWRSRSLPGKPRSVITREHAISASVGPFRPLRPLRRQPAAAANGC